MLAQFVLDDFSEIPGKLPCTSRPCGWTVPQVRKLNIQKQTIMETTVKKPRVDKITKGVGCTLYEAKHVHLMFDFMTLRLQPVFKSNRKIVILAFRCYLDYENPLNPLTGLIQNLAKYQYSLH